MELVDILRAKSKNKGKSFLLIDHIKETLERARDFKKFVEKNKNAIEYSRFDETFFKNLAVALFLHDLGKINYSFQKKVFNKEERKSDSQWKEIEKFFEKKTNENERNKKEKNCYKTIDINRHEIISTLYSYIFLDNPEDKNTQQIRTAILFHHYNDFYVNRELNIRCIFDDYPDLEKYIEFLLEKKGEIKKLLETMIDSLIESFNNKDENFIKEALSDLKAKINLEKLENLKKALENGYGLSTHIKFYEILNKKENNDDKLSKDLLDFFVFLGVLRRCDYAGSGGVNIEEITNINEIFKNLEDEIKSAVKELTGKENLWQQEILKKAKNNNFVLVAPTGSGKTEFALLWAKRAGRKLIYTLPLRVALNDLFWRFRKDEKENKGYFEKNFVGILHSTSFIEHLKEEKEGSDLEIGDKMTSAKLFSSPILLTTPDQVFLSSLRYYGFDKLVSVYPISSIVIDEIQAYNPEMAAIILKTLEIIKELKGNVLVITATFPPYFKQFINEKNGFEICDLEKEPDKTKELIKNYNLRRHKIKLIDKPVFEYRQKTKKEKEYNLVLNEETFKQIKKIIEDHKNKNIMVIVNNVGKAIKLYQELENISQKLGIKKENLYLLHSRLIEKEKKERIEKIKEKLMNEEKGLILVATQIVEASVDVDFDILITEISPIDSQIQRWGRIWRNKKPNEHYSGNNPNIYVFTGIDKGTLAIYYPKEVLEKTIEALKEIQNSNPLNHEEEKKLIENVFEKSLEDNQTLKKFYENKINEVLEWLKYWSAEKKNDAQRIFRHIAGIQVFIPNLPNQKDELYKALCKVLEDKKNWEIPFEGRTSENLIDKIKNEIKDENLKKNLDKWKILETLYNYSFNLPFFAIENFRERFKIIKRNTFKGFFVLNTKERLDELQKYGIDKILDLDLREIEMVEEENIALI